MEEEERGREESKRGGRRKSEMGQICIILSDVSEECVFRTVQKKGIKGGRGR